MPMTTIPPLLAPGNWVTKKSNILIELHDRHHSCHFSQWSSVNCQSGVQQYKNS